MSFLSDEESSELKELFFDTAAELLQALNEAGLKLEHHPGDAELVREVRRTVHTLKGDAAACGLEAVTNLAHDLEDVLTPEVAARSNGKLAEIILNAADVFSAMLDCYRTELPIPSAAPIREQIRELVARPQPKNIVPYRLSGHFAWSEYEHMSMQRAIEQGQHVYNVALAVDPHCPMKTAAMQLVKNVLCQLGNVLATFPDSGVLDEQIDVMEFAVASHEPANIFETKCRIPSVISDVLVQTAAMSGLSIADDRTETVNRAADQAGNMFGIAASSDTSSSEGSTAVSPSATTTKLRVDAERIDAVLNLVGELVISKSMLMQNMNEFEKRFGKDPLRAKFADSMTFQNRVLSDLQKSVMKIRMVPVEQLFRRFPRVVRDIAKVCGKQVTLQIAGEETDLDKSILDALAEPLSHLVRNSVDHGIESAEQRLRSGKPPHGTLKLNAYHQGNQIVIECSDDGAGIDHYKLVSRAVEKGILTREEAERISDSEALNLIFHPGLSTADQVTAISGRGVGMDVVQKVIEQLKGIISIDSKPGVGTTFLLKVPLTLAIIKALMFRVSDRLYAIPLTSVVEIARASPADIHRVDQHEVMQLRDQVLTLVRMEKLARHGRVALTEKLFIVVVAIADRKFGLIVDRLVGEEELVIKALDDHLAATQLVSGGSILGDGSVVLILNLTAVVARLGRASARLEAVTA